MRGQRLLGAGWLLAWTALSAVWCLSAAQQLGATFDEPLYIARGLECWRTASHRGLLKLGTMPLPIDVQTLPLFVWEKWTGTPLDAEADLTEMLPWARAATLVFWVLLLFYMGLIGRQLAGPWGGRLAVALSACEPNLLAHASLATTDIAVTACLLALAYHFRTGRDGPWLKRCGVPALWFGAALLAKASALVYGPICLAAIEAERWLRDGAGSASEWRCRLRPFLRDSLGIGLGGLAVAFAYCGCDFEVQPTFVEWAHQLDGPHAGYAVWFAEHCAVFSNAGEGIVRQIKHNMHGHGTYLLGESHPRALWYYFPVLLTIKLTLPLLLLPYLVALLRTRALWNWACLTAVVMLVLSLNFRVQIGVRLVLPLVAFAVVGLSAGAVQVLEGRSWRRRLVVPCCVLAVAANVVAAWTVWPHGLCYVNPLWGGPVRGYELVADSNYDWGQGLPELAAWQRHEGASVDVWYFGSDPALKQLPLRELPLHALPIAKPADVVQHTHGRYLAASTTLVHGQATTLHAHHTAAAFLRRCTPVARTTTFLIFDLQALKQVE